MAVGKKKPFHIKKKISLKMTHISAALVHFLSEFAVDWPHVNVFDFVTSILQWRFDVLHDQISERWKWLYVGKVQNQKRQEEMFFCFAAEICESTKSEFRVSLIKTMQIYQWSRRRIVCRRGQQVVEYSFSAPLSTDEYPIQTSSRADRCPHRRPPAKSIFYW